MLRTPGLLALFLAKLLSTVGSWLTVLALPWFVLVTTGSPVRMSLVLAVEFLAVALLGLPGGTLVTRFGVRRVMLVCDAARGPLLALVPLLHTVGLLRFPVLLAVAFALGGFTAPYVASQRLILTDLLGSAQRLDDGQLARANGLIDGATRIAALAGPAAGGVLIAAFGAAEVLWIDAATYLVSFLILLFFVRPAGRTTRPSRISGHATGGGALAGLRYTLRRAVLRRFLVALLTFGAVLPAVFVTLPVLVTRELGGDPRTLGLLTATNGAGVTVGSVLAVTVLGRMRDRALLLTGVAQCVPPWLLLSDHLPVVVAGLFLTGLVTPVLAATVNTRLTLRTPERLRPPVMTTAVTAENVAAFVGLSAAGPAIQYAGTGPVFAGIAILATAGSASFVAALRADAGRPEDERRDQAPTVDLPDDPPVRVPAPRPATELRPTSGRSRRS